ncbi:cholecystokinin receptor type A-like [Saccostrea echinata]|uniref:cholecystokinin receptor type A-like n=1 Tax=Saccostrea echinata TaxID=191078 RepID=UPI002A838EF3|nr:cholecystokinin receptor type A-like [Saccostrea echinata]XP_061183165.1 cholecystokinin receptor type A-like [Saccostrea echinata]
MNNFSDDVRRLNDEAVQTIIPAIIFVAILMVVGFVGNPAIVYFYGFKLRPTPSYMFIVALAVFDFIACVVSMPMELVDLIRFYTFENAAACKVLRFVNYFMAISSGLILLAIAVDRYRKICKPFESQLSFKMAKIIISCVLFASLCISWPSLLFYTVVQVNLTEIDGAVGQDCTTKRDDSYKFYIAIYNGILFLIFIICNTSLIALYCRVGKKIFKLRSFRFYAQRKRKISTAQPQSSTLQNTEETDGLGSKMSSSFTKNPNLDDLSTPNRRDSGRSIVGATLELMTKKLVTSPEDIKIDTSNPFNGGGNSGTVNYPLELNVLLVPSRSNAALSDQTSTNGINTRDESIKTKTMLGQNQVQSSPEEDGSKRKGEINEAKSIKIVDQKKMSTHSIKTRQYTVIMLSITVAYVISFLPYLCLVTWRTVAKGYEPNLLSKSELVAFQIFLRSFLINNAVNPLIYGFLNTEFRHFIFACFCCWARRKNRYHGSPRRKNSGH